MSIRLFLTWYCSQLLKSMSYKIRSLLFLFGFLIITVTYNSLDRYEFWNQKQSDPTVMVQKESEEIVDIYLDTDDSQ